MTHSFPTLRSSDLFEWILHAAFEMGYRVGIVANSDGHKGRPGASYPGASLFGAIGGLTCLLTPELTRAGLLDCLRKRHHYGTTGNRMILDVRAAFDAPAMVYQDRKSTRLNSTH